MWICSTYGTEMPLDPEANMNEVRMDVFKEIPEGIGDNTIIRLCGRDMSLIPEGFTGLVDAEERIVPPEFRSIRSFHDFESTPSSNRIVQLMMMGKQEISKGAFKVNTFTDLRSIKNASAVLQRRHVIVGMGELGQVTRIRQHALNNLFTYGYVGKPTAEGQFSAETLRGFGNDCKIVGLTGYGISGSLSPAMQNAAIKEAGINAVYLRFDSENVRFIGDVIRDYDILGMNVTSPHKQAVVEHMDYISQEAAAIKAVNTIVNLGGKLQGHNTDVDGIYFAFDKYGVDIRGKKILILGSGGAARATAYACVCKDCEVFVKGRNPLTVKSLCDDLMATPVEYDGVVGYDIIVNCTTVGMNGETDYPVDLSGLSADQTVLDLVYQRPTELVRVAMARGCKVIPGKEVLIAQGALSFTMWFRQPPNMAAMEKAIE